MCEELKNCYLFHKTAIMQEQIFSLRELLPSLFNLPIVAMSLQSTPLNNDKLLSILDQVGLDGIDLIYHEDDLQIGRQQLLLQSKLSLVSNRHILDLGDFTKLADFAGLISNKQNATAEQYIATIAWFARLLKQLVSKGFSLNQWYQLDIDRTFAKHGEQPPKGSSLLDAIWSELAELKNPYTSSDIFGGQSPDAWGGSDALDQLTELGDLQCYVIAFSRYVQNKSLDAAIITNWVKRAMRHSYLVDNRRRKNKEAESNLLQQLKI